MNVENAGDRWFYCRTPRPLATKRLFCFPFGGGGASVFRSWPDAMGSHIEIRALQLPGRETRFNEPRAKNLDRLIKDIVEALSDYRDKPCAYFGYSLGAMLAFEVSREQRRQHQRLPERLFLAAHGAPQLPPPISPISALPDDEFVKKVEYYYQPQNEAWDDLELRELILPLLRDDIALYESYDYRQEAPLTCPIDVFAGNEDRATPIESTRYWSAQTTGKVRHHAFKGGHFFLDEAIDEIQSLVLNTLMQST